MGFGSSSGMKARSRAVMMAAICCGSLSSPALAANARFAPTLIRYSQRCGDQIILVAHGQLWSVPASGGTAKPLTAGPGNRYAAKCSPDGKWIAYTALVGDAQDVFVLPRGGGSPRRLTFRPDLSNLVLGWNADSRSVVFSSPREDWSGRKSKAYAVPVEGGLPQPLPLDRVGDLSIAPDGRRVAYTSFRPNWKRYQGGQAPDILLYDPRSHRQEKITDWQGTDTAPMWAGERIYFLSDRDRHRKLNLWSYDLRDRRTRQVTFFDDYDIDTPSLGTGAITFSQGGKLWMLDLRTERLQTVSVSVPDDGALTSPRTVAVKEQLREFDTDYDTDYTLSPRGETALLAGRGDLFTHGIADAASLNLTATSDAEEDHPAVSPDGTLIAYTTDSSGEQQLAVRPISGGAERILTHSKKGFFYQPVWSPDGRRIAIHDAAHRLWLIDLQGGEPRLVAYNREHYMHETDEHDAIFSPDGRWLVYSLSRPNRLRALHFFDTVTGSDTVVSSPMESDYRAAFSSDGRFLYFVSDRHDIPIYADRETNAVTVKSSGIYVAALSPADVPPFSPNSTTRVAMPKAVRGSIDLTGLMSRAVPVPVEATTITAMAMRGNRLFYRSEPPPVIEGTLPGESSHLHVVDVLRNEDRIVVDDLSSFAVSADGSRILFVRGGKWLTADGNGADQRPLDVDRMKTRIDPRAEWREMFFNSWRLERDLYVDADMHGIDWAGVRDHYARLLPLLGSRSDLNWLIGQMIGELAGSHIRVGEGDHGQAGTPERTVLLGADYALDRSNGRYRFARIFRGDNTRPDYRGPLSWPGVNAQEGDYVLAVNGHELRAPDSPDAALSATSGPVTLTLASRPNGARRTTVVLPVASEERLRELAHFDDKRALVARLSHGRIAYIDLTDMVGLGMRQFVRQFYPQLGAEALVIDDRGNPGGNIDEMILERLRRTLSSMQTGRDRVPQTQPDQVMLGPKAMLIDAASSSDGEVFPLHFREYGLGELIGSRTWGGVRGLRTYWTLLDGGTVSASEISFYDTQGHWVVENHGVVPDIEVEPTLDDIAAGRDPALETAVARLLAKIGPVRRGLVPPPSGGSDYPPAGDVPPTYLPVSRPTPEGVAAR
jgi:tricorn protease